MRSIRRTADGVEIRAATAGYGTYDRVVVATHADQALALLEDPSEEERRALGAFAYTVNETVLHTDSSLLPRSRAARASWNYRTGDDGRPTVTYYLNRLQGLESERDYCVTLNQDVDRGARARAAHVHAPALHRRDAAGADGAAAGVGRAAHALCGRTPRERLPRGRPRLRASPPRQRSGWRW